MKYDLHFYEEWVAEKINIKLVPLLDDLVGTKCRFRDTIDRKKNYLFHSPVSELVKRKEITYRKWYSYFDYIPIRLDLLNKDEIKKYDRFLTFKVVFRGNAFADEEDTVCAYITLHIKPCKVEPLRVGGIDDGSEITGYDIEFQNGCSETTAHSFMLVKPKRYYKWLETNMKNEYLSVVNDVINDEEQSEPFSTIRYLTDKLEQDMKQAKRLTYQLY